jgi:DNA-binding FadR family transcriptional regulator
MTIDPQSSADLSVQIASAIRDAIVAGDLLFDQRLPSEAELSDQFRVSRHTVREALKRLAAQSLIRTLLSRRETGTQNLQLPQRGR